MYTFDVNALTSDALLALDQRLANAAGRRSHDLNLEICMLFLKVFNSLQSQLVSCAGTQIYNQYVVSTIFLLLSHEYTNDVLFVSVTLNSDPTVNWTISFAELASLCFFA